MRLSRDREHYISTPELPHATLCYKFINCLEKYVNTENSGRRSHRYEFQRLGHVLLVWGLSCRKGHWLKTFSIYSYLLLVLCDTLAGAWQLVRSSAFPQGTLQWGGAVKSNGISTSLLTTKQRVGVLLQSFQCFSLMTLG